MQDPAMSERQAAYTNWARAELLRICERLRATEVIGSDALARVAWTVPHELLIARVWSEGRESEALWATGGNLPIDCLSIKLAPAPREAARHFCLRWQLEAARNRDLGKDVQSRGVEPSVWQAIGSSLEEKAELLNEYVLRDELWGPDNIPDLADALGAGR